MVATFQDLPPKALYLIAGFIAHHSPSEFLNLLVLSKPLHESVCEETFRSLSLPDDARLFSRGQDFLPIPQDPISAFILNPQRYGSHVKKLIITDPLVCAANHSNASTRSSFSNSNLGLFGEIDVIHEEEDDYVVEEDANAGIEGLSRVQDEEAAPLEANTIVDVLRSCDNLEDIVWAGSCPPPDALCEFLATNNLRLRSFCYTPTLTKQSSSKWDATSLPLLVTLTSLTLTRLSHTGAKSLSLLLVALSEADDSSPSSLEELDINFVWLDDALCERIVAAGSRRLRRLTIGTQGTKLTDAGILSLLEGLESLEELALLNVEGRLSKSLWSKVDVDMLPPRLTKLVIGMPSSGPAHSWSLDHLQSIHCLPIQLLRHLAILRTPPVDTNGSSDACSALQSVPREMLDLLRRSGQALTVLECDWWGWSPEDVKLILDSCTNLETLNITFDAPFARLVASAGSFSSATNLRKVVINIPSEHAGSPPSSPAVNPLSPTASPTMTRSTPSRGNIGLPASPATPYLVSRRDSSSKPSSNGTSAYFEPSSPATSFSQASVFTDGSPLQSIRSIPIVLDPLLPPIRDLKKFFKRCAALQQLEWVGRGTWVVDSTPPSIMAKTTSLANIKVDFIPNSHLGEVGPRQDMSLKAKWSSMAIERVGQKWKGEMAELIAKDMEELFPEKEKEPTPEPPPRKALTRRRSTTSAPATPVTPTPNKKSPSPSEAHAKPERHRGGSKIETTSSHGPRRSPSVSTIPLTNGHGHVIIGSGTLASRERAHPSPHSPVNGVQDNKRMHFDAPNHGGRHRQRATSSSEGGAGERRHTSERPRRASGSVPVTPGEEQRANGRPARGGGGGGRGSNGNRRRGEGGQPWRESIPP